MNNVMAYVICLVCLVCLIAGGVGALSILLLQIRDACRLRNILKDYKESGYKVPRDAWRQRLSAMWLTRRLEKLRRHLMIRL